MAVSSRWLDGPRRQFLWARLRGVQLRIDDVAHEHEILSPAFTGDTPAALMLPGQLDHVSALQEETWQALEDRRLRGGPVQHRATSHYVLRDATFVQDDLYAGGMRQSLRPSASRAAIAGRVHEEMDEAALVQTFAGNQYFGHWLLDDRAIHLLAREHSPRARPVGVPAKLSEQQRDILNAYDQSIHTVRATRVRRLHVYDDIGQTPHRTERLQRMRARYRAIGAEAVAAGLPSGAGKIVFVCRGLGGVRRILHNETALADAMEKRGAMVIRKPEALSLQKIAALFANAAAVVGLDSSALAHGILGVVAGGAFVDIMPGYRFCNTWKDWCDPLGLRYAVVVAPAMGDGCIVDEGDVSRTLDLVC